MSCRVWLLTDEPDVSPPDTKNRSKILLNSHVVFFLILNRPSAAVEGETLTERRLRMLFRPNRLLMAASNTQKSETHRRPNV